MHRRAPHPRETWTLAFALGACLAASCNLPLSHFCRTSNDCISGMCIEGTCQGGQNDGAMSDSSMVDAVDATPDSPDATPAQQDSMADDHDATADQSIDSPADNGADVTPTDAGNPIPSPDGATDGTADNAPGSTDAGPPGPPPPQACGPAWPDWIMPAPATLTGVPGDPVRNLPNPTSYDTSNPDVVVDNVTHLVWQRVISTNALTYDQAASYCDSLDLGGRTDWRLPSRIELVSLIDWDRARQGNIDSVFTDAPSLTVWACTPGAGNPLNAWIVDFSKGAIGGAWKTDTELARCVSGSWSSTPPPARYQVGTDGLHTTVTDVKTLLTWQADPAPTQLNWGDGYTYCQGLGPGWRLPTVVELETLIDETQITSAVDPSTFPDAPDDFYWTSSFFDSDSGNAWFVSIGAGNTYWNPTDTLWHVRCVR